MDAEKIKNIILSTIITALATALASGIIYKFFKSKSSINIEGEKSQGISEGCKYFKPTFPLRKGAGMGTLGVCERQYVKIIQQYLNLYKLSPMIVLEVDGKWGDNTNNALFSILNKTEVDEVLFNKMQKAIESK